MDKKQTIVWIATALLKMLATAAAARWGDKVVPFIDDPALADAIAVIAVASISTWHSAKRNATLLATPAPEAAAALTRTGAPSRCAN